jgi:hypothetical protein
MTPAQIELARHALGLPNERMSSYRNRFICVLGHRAYRKWKRMVTNGCAERSIFSKERYTRYLFSLTREGAEMALKPGERLDVEDFP